MRTDPTAPVPRIVVHLIAVLWIAATFVRVAAAQPPGLASLGIKGQLTFKNFSYFADTPTDDQVVRNEGILQLEWARRFGAWGGLKLVGEARGDDSGDAEGVRFQIPDTALRRSILDLKEATASLRREPVEITVGKQIFAWGTADAFNPTDNLNPYDYMDVLDNQKLGIYAVAGVLSVQPTTLTVVVVPVFTPSRLPREDSRWTPAPPPGFVAVVDDRQLPGAAAGTVQYAARLRATLAGWDVSASYYRGFEDTPVFRLGTAEVGPGVVVPRFTPVFTKMHVAGLDFSTTFLRFEVHGEGAFKIVDRDGRTDRFQGIAGFNYTWDGLGLRWLDQITVILEYGREVVLRMHPESGIVDRGEASQVGDLLADNAFENGLIGRVQFKISEDTQVKLTGLADFARAFSSYAQVKVAHRFSDAFQAEVGLDVLSGPEGSFWGRWRNNDRFFLALKYLF